MEWEEWWKYDKGIASNTTVPVGHSYRPGVYYAEVLTLKLPIMQDGKRVTLKLVKGAPWTIGIFYFLAPLHLVNQMTQQLLRS
jgi:hypothetical protein